MASARQYFPKNKQVKSCWAAELFTVFYSIHEMWVNFLWHLSRKPKKTQKNNHTCMCLCSHLGAVEDYGVTSPGIDPGSRHFLRKFGKIHREASQPLGIPWLSSTSFEMSNATSASLHRCAIPPHFLNEPLRNQALYIQRPDSLREHHVLPQKGHWLTSSPLHVPTEVLKWHICEDTVNLK